MIATSSNHAELIVIHEVSRECVWLRSITQHIQETCDLSLGRNVSTILCKDNAACIARRKWRYIKRDRTKHI